MESKVVIEAINKHQVISSQNEKDILNVLEPDVMVELTDGSWALRIDENMNGMTLNPKDLYEYLCEMYSDKTIITKFDSKIIKFWNRSANEYSRSKSSLITNGFGKTALADHLVSVIEHSKPGYFEPRIHDSRNGKTLGKNGYERRNAKIVDSNGDVYEMDILIGLNNQISSQYFGNNFYDIINISFNKLIKEKVTPVKKIAT